MSVCEQDQPANASALSPYLPSSSSSSSSSFQGLRHGLASVEWTQTRLAHRVGVLNASSLGNDVRNGQYSDRFLAFQLGAWDLEHVVLDPFALNRSRLCGPTPVSSVMCTAWEGGGVWGV